MPQQYADALAAAGGERRSAHAMGAFSYSSGVSDHGEGSALAACLPGTPMQVRSSSTYGIYCPEAGAGLSVTQAQHDCKRCKQRFPMCYDLSATGWLAELNPERLSARVLPSADRAFLSPEAPSTRRFHVKVRLTNEAMPNSCHCGC